MKTLNQLLDRESANELIASYCLDTPLDNAIERLLDSDLPVACYETGLTPNDYVAIQDTDSGWTYAISQRDLDTVLYG